MALRILSLVKSKSFTMSVTAPTARDALGMVKVAKDAAANPRKVLKIWRIDVLAAMRQRFASSVGPNGKPWRDLTGDTKGIREHQGLTRIKPRRGGGRPVQILRGMGEYFQAWGSTSKGGRHRPSDKIRITSPESFWKLGVNHIAVINEFKRTTKGLIPDRSVPARSVAYIRGDKRLLNRLVDVFVAYIMKSLEKAEKAK